MTNSETATVETLAAEVRVLMVGKRQVTLSVAKQLDAFELDDDDALNFDPFGRIRTGAKGQKYVRCSSTDKGREWFPNQVAKCDYAPHCNHFRREFDGVATCGHFEHLELREYDHEWIGRHTPTGSLIAVRAFSDEHKSELQEFPSWLDLPLIVLAGLR